MAGSGGAGAAPREHRLQPGDTLPGLALRYGVTMEQIQRANRLYTTDTIFLKPTLLIPAPAHRDHRDHHRDHRDIPGDIPGDIPEDGPEPPSPSRHDLSASDFLRRLDAEIGRSKEAAALRIRGPGNSHFKEATAQQLQSQNTSPALAGGGRSPSSPRGARLGPRPLTRNPRAAALRDSEDEIFTL